MTSSIEGKHAVLEALRSGTSVRRITLASGLESSPAVDEIRELAVSRGIPVDVRDRKDLDAQSVRGAHQGVVAEVAAFAYTPLAALLDETDDAPESLVVVLDHVTDPGNLGAIIRSVEALGADGVVVPKARAAGIGPVALKTSAGSALHLPIVQVANVSRTIDELKKRGYWVAGASAEGETDAGEAALEGRLVIVVGSEGEGLSRIVEQACDFIVRIPTTGRTASLNVAQAATILAYEWSRSRDA
jgi:23S rRNA (guanosine2251-2'-O)-methyltransferase